MLFFVNVSNLTDELFIIISISGLTLLFEHSPSWASEIEHFEIFSRPQEIKLTQGFFIKFNLLLFFLISLGQS